MSYRISLTVDALTRFINVEMAYFTNLETLPGKTRNPVMLISEINKEVEDLLVLRKELDHQRDLLHGRSQKVRYVFLTLSYSRGKVLKSTDTLVSENSWKKASNWTTTPLQPCNTRMQCLLLLSRFLPRSGCPLAVIIRFLP